MRNLFTIFYGMMLLAYGLPAHGQNCGAKCNIIKNPCLTGIIKSKKHKEQPLVFGRIPPWNATHGTPSYLYGVNKSSPTALELAANNAGPYKFSEGYAQGVGLVAGREYIVAINAIRLTSKPDSVFVGFMGQMPAFSKFYYPTIHEFVALRANVSQNQWTLFADCFVPDSAYGHIWVHNRPPVHNKLGKKHETMSGTDDVELIENFDFALRDTVVCQPGTPVGLSTTCDDFLNFTASYEWRDLGTNQVVGSTRSITVQPLVTTQYQCKRTLSGMPGCPGYDTVTVEVGSPPILVHLGPDTAICAPDSLVLDAGYHGPSYATEWHKGFIRNLIGRGQTYVVTTTGLYIAQVIDTLSGCYFRDSIHVTVNPEIHVYPDTLYTCDTGRNYTFDAGTGFVAYEWDGDPANNSRYFSTNIPGIHVVEVTDSNGCTGKDTALLVYRPFTFSLPNDTVVCPGSCVWVPVKTDSAFVQYSWDDGSGDTSRLICQPGAYALTITDSLGCTYTDTIRIYHHPEPQLNLPNHGPICLHDTAILLLNPSGHVGAFYNDYVWLNVFTVGRLWAGPGRHWVYYAYNDTAFVATDTHVCPFFDSLYVDVSPLDTIRIDTVGPLCAQGPAWPLAATPAGGVFKDSTGATITAFDPSVYGVGLHRLYYEYTDTMSCLGRDSTRVRVLPPPDIGFGHDSAYCVPAYGMVVWVTYDSLLYPGLRFLWSTGDTTRRARYQCGDTLVLQAYTADSLCFATDTFVNEVTCCCDLQPSFGPDDDLVFGFDNPLNWSGLDLVLDRDVVIQSQYDLGVIMNCRLVMQNCARIIVEGGAELKIDSCQIGFCRWEGIEVWGNIDACSDEWLAQGRLYMENTELTCANVGVLSGGRDYSNGIKFTFAFIGGVMHLTNNHFKANYVDVLFTPDSYLGICKCNPPLGDGRKMQSSITNNFFDTLANTYICHDFVDPLLTGLNGYFNGSPLLCFPPKWNNSPPPPDRCHIIDLSPYIEYFIYLPGSPLICGDACTRKAWEDSKHNSGETAVNNSYIGRSFNNIIIDCHDFLPADYHD